VRDSHRGEAYLARCRHRRKSPNATSQMCVFVSFPLSAPLLSSRLKRRLRAGRRAWRAYYVVLPQVASPLRPSTFHTLADVASHAPYILCAGPGDDAPQRGFGALDRAPQAGSPVCDLRAALWPSMPRHVGLRPPSQHHPPDPPPIGLSPSHGRQFQRIFSVVGRL
jgi:hypothetical protein